MNIEPAPSTTPSLDTLISLSSNLKGNDARLSQLYLRVKREPGQQKPVFEEKTIWQKIKLFFSKDKSSYNLEKNADVIHELFANAFNEVLTNSDNRTQECLVRLQNCAERFQAFFEAASNNKGLSKSVFDDTSALTAAKKSASTFLQEKITVNDSTFNETKNIQDVHKKVTELLRSHQEKENLHNIELMIDDKIQTQNVMPNLLTDLPKKALSAALNGEMAVLQSLLKQGVDVNSPIKDGYTLLYAAARNGHKGCLELLLDNGANVNDLPNKNGDTSLHTAARNGHKDCLELLLDKGANVDLPNKNGYTPLHIAAHNGRTDILKILLDKGANVDQPDTTGETSLHVAASNGHIECLKLLLDNNANIDLPNKNGYTPLHIVVQNGRTDIIKILLDNNANVDQPENHHKLTPLHMAAYDGNKECLKLLLEKTTNVNQPSTAGLTPLHAATKKGNTECLKLLLENGADPNKRTNKPNWTPLHMAAQIGNVDCCLLLSEHNADTNIQDIDGDTPLHIATNNGKENVVTILLEKGAKADIKNKNGETPADIAMKDPRGNKKIKGILATSSVLTKRIANEKRERIDAEQTQTKPTTREKPT